MFWPANKQIPVASNVAQLPAYIFHILNDWTLELTQKGISYDKLSIGAPDMPPPNFINDAAIEALRSNTFNIYSPFDGYAWFKKAAALWLKERFHINVNPEKHIILLIGSKEGLGHFPFAIAEHGDDILVPDPGYPAYQTSLKVARVRPNFYTLNEHTDYFLDFNAIQKTITSKTKCIYVNFPHNPTGKCVTRAEFKKITEYFLKQGIVVVSDHPYSELWRDHAEKPCSILEVCDWEKEPVIEFFSLSKMMNMCGWRVGFAVGNEKLISSLRVVKTHLDTGQFGVVQKAAESAFLKSKERESFLEELRQTYHRRFIAAENALKEIGFTFKSADGTFYLWVKTPKNMNDMDWAYTLLQKAKVLVTPGSAFGPGSTNYFRLTMTSPEAKLKEVIRRFPQALP